MYKNLLIGILFTTSCMIRKSQINSPSSTEPPLSLNSETVDTDSNRMDSLILIEPSSLPKNSLNGHLSSDSLSPIERLTNSDLQNKKERESRIYKIVGSGITATGLTLAALLYIRQKKISLKGLNPDDWHIKIISPQEVFKLSYTRLTQGQIKTTPRLISHLKSVDSLKESHHANLAALVQMEKILFQKQKTLDPQSAEKMANHLKELGDFLTQKSFSQKPLSDSDLAKIKAIVSEIWGKDEAASIFTQLISKNMPEGGGFTNMLVASRYQHALENLKKFDTDKVIQSLTWVPEPLKNDMQKLASHEELLSYLSKIYAELLIYAHNMSEFEENLLTLSQKGSNLTEANKKEFIDILERTFNTIVEQNTHVLFKIEPDLTLKPTAEAQRLSEFLEFPKLLTLDLNDPKNIQSFLVEYKNLSMKLKKTIAISKDENIKGIIRSAIGIYDNDSKIPFVEQWALGQFFQKYANRLKEISQNPNEFKQLSDATFTKNLLNDQIHQVVQDMHRNSILYNISLKEAARVLQDWFQNASIDMRKQFKENVQKGKDAFLNFFNRNSKKNLSIP